MNKKIITYGRHYIDNKDRNSVLNALKSESLTQGPIVKKFEKKISKTLGSKYALAVTNGTSALYMCGRVLEWSSKSNVIISPLTFIAGANAASICGANIYLCDIDKNSFCIDTKKLEKKIINLKKNKIKITTVIATDYSGNVCDWEQLNILSKKYNFNLINDNCHAIGSEYNKTKKYSSKYAHFTCLSFHPVKVITSGEGGAILTNNKKYYHKLFALRENGIIRNKKKWYDYDVINPSLNFRMNEIQASLVLSQLKKLNFFIEKRRKIAKFYDLHFKNMSQIVSRFIFKNVVSSFHLYSLLIKFDLLKIDKEKFIEELFKKYKIKLQIHYKPLFKFSYYKNKKGLKNQLPETLKFLERAVSIPIYPQLSKKNQIYIVKSIKELIIKNLK